MVGNVSQITEKTPAIKQIRDRKNDGCLRNVLKGENK